MSLHNEIMNIQIVPIDSAGFGRTLDYKLGHRDARHAAAELSLKYERYIEQLEELIEEVMPSDLLSEIRKECGL